MQPVLRALELTDGPEVWRAHEIMAQEGYDFLLEFASKEEPFGQYLARVERIASGDVADGRVRADLFVAEYAGEIAGRLSVRHELTSRLRELYGHIGYMVLPKFRRRGIATFLLSCGVQILRSEGVREILVSCDDENVASAAVIERCGGVLLNRVEQPGTRSLLRRYHIVPVAEPSTD